VSIFVQRVILRCLVVLFSLENHFRNLSHTQTWSISRGRVNKRDSKLHNFAFSSSFPFSRLKASPHDHSLSSLDPSLSTLDDFALVVQ